jgi:tetratricopeptide (TPR) repeat protein
MSADQAKQFLDQATQSIQGGQPAQALELIRQAIQLNPGNPEAHMLHGIALAQTQQPTQAAEAFREAIRLDPNSAKAHYNLAVHLHSQHERTAALEQAKLALERDPQHAGARDLSARIQAELGTAPSARVADSPAPGGPPPVVDPGISEQPPLGQQPPVAEQPAFTGQVPPTGHQPPPSYYRSGYDLPAHSLAFVEKLGKKWLGIGWALIALHVVIVALNLITSAEELAALSSPTAFMQFIESMDQTAGVADWILAILSLLAILSMITWMILDLVDNRGNFLWLLPFFTCCLCTFGYLPAVVVAIYILAGRN